MKRGLTSIRAEAARVLLAAGWTRKAISTALDWNYAVLCSVTHEADKPNPLRDVSREKRMAELYRSGKTLEDIGDEFNLTRERVRQLLVKQGVKRTEGGRHLQLVLMQPQRDAEAKQATAIRFGRQNFRTEYIYGCRYEELLALNGGFGPSRAHSRARQYVYHRKNADDRGIAWQLTFPQWCEIWEKSGKEALRGRGKGKFCMSRAGDVGPYSVGNVRICEFEVNSKEASKLIGAYGDRRLGRKQALDSRGMTKRQSEIYDLWDGGQQQPIDIGRQLGLKPTTVSTVLSICRRKVKELAA